MISMCATSERVCEAVHGAFAAVRFMEHFLHDNDGKQDLLGTGQANDDQATWMVSAVVGPTTYALSIAQARLVADAVELCFKVDPPATEDAAVATLSELALMIRYVADLAERGKPS